VPTLARPLPLAEIPRAAGLDELDEKYLLLPNVLKRKRDVRAVRSAVFRQARVDESPGAVRVTRAVGAHAAGRIPAR